MFADRPRVLGVDPWLGKRSEGHAAKILSVRRSPAEGGSQEDEIIVKLRSRRYWHAGIALWDPPRVSCYFDVDSVELLAHIAVRATRI